MTIPETVGMGAPPPIVAETCESCPNPGVCCRDFGLTGSGGEVRFYREIPGSAVSEADLEIAALAAGLPFRPNRRRFIATDQVGEFEIWTWRCPHVTRDGRCAIYETRPEVCRSYRPGVDAMCALHPEHVPPTLHPEDMK